MIQMTLFLGSVKTKVGSIKRPHLPSDHILPVDAQLACVDALSSELCGRKAKNSEKTHEDHDSFLIQAEMI